jgi:hypothetical protein
MAGMGEKTSLGQLIGGNCGGWVWVIVWTGLGGEHHRSTNVSRLLRGYLTNFSVKG